MVRLEQGVQGLQVLVECQGVVFPQNAYLKELLLAVLAVCSLRQNQAVQQASRQKVSVRLEIALDS